MNEAFNRDCVEAMKEFPDGFFDLAVVDPPYGGGFTEGGGCKGWFSKYHENDSQFVKVERERERESGRRGTALASASINTRHYAFGARKKDATYQAKKQQAEEIRKKLFRGT